jgi:3-hydroxyisobutyrate dehydrogenase-like beta-hydroxyacid dehydrogenase
MGYPMARNLLQKTNGNFIVCDAVSEVSAKFVSETSSHQPNVRKAATPEEVASEADVIITMLPNSSIVDQVYLGMQGLKSGLLKKKGVLCIDSSTIDPTTARRVSGEIKNAGSFMVRRPSVYMCQLKSILFNLS